MKTKQTLIQICLLVAALLSVLKSHAATNTVTNTEDSGPGTLRHFMASATSGDTINFATNLSGATITLTSGYLILSNNLSIDASALPGGIQINGSSSDRVFYVTNVSAGVLTSLIITNGRNAAGGGGIYTDHSTLTLNRCVVTGNYSATGIGGGVFNNYGTLTLNKGTVTGNFAGSGGGGLCNIQGSLAVNECTVAGNSETGSGTGTGAGIYNLSSGGILTVNQSTVTGNNSASSLGAGGLYSYGASSITNSIVAGNSAATISGADIIADTLTLKLGGANIVQHYSQINGGTISGTTPVNAAPQLAALGNYGSLTPTLPPLPGSPAIDAGSDLATNLFATDQRGFPRLAGLHVDIGAVEFGSGNLVVTSAADSGSGSLRQCIASAAPGDIINFATNLASATLTLTSGQLTLTNNLSIDASALPGGIQINGNATSRIFCITNGPVVVLNGLAIANGYAPPGSFNGGGIYNASSTLTLNQCILTGNYSTNPISGGGIYNGNGTVTLNRCTMTGNHVTGLGGGICNYGTLTLNQSTLSGNYNTLNATEASGGIFNFGTLIVNQSTLSGNFTTADQAAGGIYSIGALFLTNSIVAGNIAYTASEGDIVTDTLTTQAGGTNIVQHYSQLYGGTFSGTPPLTNAPLLAPLDNYGGLTQTMPPLPGSPAIDAGSDIATNFFTTDQRGYPRRVGLRVDIGAVESAPVSPVVTIAADDGVGSLRQAILFATNGTAITFASNLSGFVIPLQTGQLNLNNSLAIDASALPNGIQIVGNGIFRIFNVANGTVVTLTALSIANGNGQIVPVNGNYGGGGIYNAGSLTLNRCTLSGNNANFLNSGTTGGGGIYNSGTLTLNECTLNGNHADFSAGGGGAIFNDINGNVFVNQSTLTGNSANNGGDGGGGIYNYNNLTIYNSIVAGNSIISGSGADVYNPSSSASLNGVNLIQDFNGSYFGTTPINAAPQLSSLGYYDGPTPTMPPLPGSPVIDACFSGSVFATDQRGFPRVLGYAPDIGAMEGVYAANGPGKLTGMTRLGNGSTQFTFTNYTDTANTVLASTNVALPLNLWSNLGLVAESPIGSGHFQFTDLQATNYPQRFYRAREN